jgi:hypothetical protein
MADITKRTGKKMAEYLQPGETVRAAVLVEPKGTYGLGGAGLVVAPRTTTGVLEGRAAESRPDGLANSFPAGPAVIAVTDRRVLVAPSNGMRFDAPAVDVPLGTLLVRSISGKGLGKKIELVFSDGTGVTVDAQRGQPFDDLSSLLGWAP